MDILDRGFINTPAQPLDSNTNKFNKPHQLPKVYPRNLLLQILLVTLALFLYISGFYLIFKNKITNIAIPDASPVANTNLVSDPTAGWTVYQLDKLGVEFKVPEWLTANDFFGIEQKVETGNIICADFSQKQLLNLFTKVYAGGVGCFSNNAVFGIGASSYNFSTGRMTNFTDYQGYTVEGNQFFTKLSDKQISIRSDLAALRTNVNNIQYLKITGVSQFEQGISFPLSGTPGEGYIGALINLPNTQYLGMAVQMKLDEKMTEDMFNQILSTFKFI